jgi:serine/threonine protein phosphatase 1
MRPPGGGPPLATAAPPEQRTAAALAETRERGRFAKLVRSRRIWAIAAIHGEVDRLARLHDEIGRAWASGDRLVYLGNYLGRGVAIARTIDEILAFRRAVLALERNFIGDVAFLRGSQEEMWQKLLQLQFAVSPREVLQWMLDQGAGATLAAYGGDAKHGFAACREGPRAITRWTSALRAALNAIPGHSQFLSALRRAALTEDGALLFVHAGLDVGRPLDTQGDAFWWGGRRLLELAEPYAGFRRVIRGYDHAHLGLVEAPFATSIDAGCGFGGQLLAVCFAPDGTVLQSLSS